jgi:hypothetical protein
LPIAPKKRSAGILPASVANLPLMQKSILVPDAKTIERIRNDWFNWLADLFGWQARCLRYGGLVEIDRAKGE